MPVTSFKATIMFTLLLGVLTTADAGVYKCVAADGSLTYSQTPCPGQKTTTVATMKSTTDDALDCRHAGQFALSVARSMKRGRGSADMFAQYGGIEGLSKSAVNIINYVYLFQHSSDLSADRIAALSGKKCKARAFGDANCESMPFAYVEQIGGCDDDAEADGEEQQQAVVAGDLSPPDGTLTSVPPSTRLESTHFEQNEDRSRDCKDRLQREIDGINDGMRSGYSSQQGENYRERLRALRKQKSEC